MYGKGVINPSFRQRTAYHAVLLGGMALITSALIVIGNKQTKADIELRRIEDTKKSLAQVIHPDTHTNDLLKDVVELKVDDETKIIHLAKSNNKVIAVAFTSTVQGYAGPIEVLVGINRTGKLLGARVLSHSETPGLGDKIEAEKNPWIFSFNGLSLNDPGESKWKVKKDGGYFDQFTGATITPRAVIKAIKTSLEIFNANKVIVLSEAKPKETETSLQEAGKLDKSPDQGIPDQETSGQEMSGQKASDQNSKSDHELASKGNSNDR